MKIYLCSELSRESGHRRAKAKPPFKPRHLSALLVCLLLLILSVSVQAQTVNLNVTKAPLKAVLEEIKQQTGYRYWYDSKMLEHTVPVTIEVTNADLKTVLDLCMENQPITYELTKKTIALKWKPASFLDKAIKAIKGIRFSGTIQDESGKPMPGVTVRDKNSTAMAMTDESGAFTIETPEENTILQFSYIGYQLIESKAAPGMSVTLFAAVNQLEELSIVSTGYQILPKERATGSFSKVDNTLFNRRVSTNVLERLEGIVPGLAFSTNYDSTNPRQGEFSIRGVSTIYANARPLIVVDNFPFDGDLYNLNPNDIESVTVLKDAAAASIWGARSGNGVVVITTKKGKAGAPLNIELNANYTYTEKPDIYYDRNFIDASSFIDAEKFLFERGYFDSTLGNTTNRPVVSPVVELLDQQRSLAANDVAGRAKLDDQIDAYRELDIRDDLTKYIYRSSGKQQYSMNLNGGGTKAAYYFSTGYDKIPSSLAGNNSERISLSSGLTYKPVKNLEIASSINYSNNNGTANYSWLGRSYYYPYAQLADENGMHLALPRNYRQSYIESLTNTQLLDWSFRPLDDLQNGDKTTRNNYTRINAGLNYIFIPGLSLDLKYQLEKQNNTTRDFQSQELYNTRNTINLFTQISGTTVTRPVPVGGILFQDVEALTGNSFRAQINFNRTIANEHEIAILGGVDSKEVITNQNRWTLYGYNDLIGTSVPVAYGTTFPKFSNLSFPGFIDYYDTVEKLTDEYFSYFTNGAYTFKRRYILSGSARIDQSNLFGVNTNQKSVPLWSTGAAWIVSSESFYHVAWLPYLKLRATYGYNGNIDKSVSAFTTARFRGTSSITNAPYAEILNPPNPELRWEQLAVFNVGIDFGSNNNTLSGSIEYYDKRGRDIIGFGPVDPTTGVNQFKGNVAGIKGNGIDIEVNYRAGNRLKWLSTVQFSRSLNKVTNYNRTTNLASYLQFGDGLTGVDLLTPVVGRPVYSIYSYPWAGLDPLNGDPQGFVNGIVSKDYAAIRGSSDINTAIYHGSSRPTTFGSLRNTFSYRGVSVSVNVMYKLGYYFRKPSIDYNSMATTWTANSDYVNRWQTSGDEEHTIVPSFVYPLNTLRDEFYKYAEVNVEKADHIRLQDIQLSYEVPGSLTGKNVKRLQLYGYINNLGVIWRANRKGIDPDYATSQYINPKSFAFGIRSTF